MIKQIQLRGISRTPSDRLSEDGGLSESLNMYMDTAENAPAIVPKDVTTDLGLPEALQAERIFIHKTVNYENYIVVQAGRVVAYTPDVEDEEPLTVLDLADGEQVNDIASVGNTLVISTNKLFYYYLFRDRMYSFLGNKVPFLNMTFEKVPVESDIEFEYHAGYTYDIHAANHSESHWNKMWFRKDGSWDSNSNQAFAGSSFTGVLPEESLWTKENFTSSNNNESDDSYWFKDFQSDVELTVSTKIEETLKNGVFCGSVFVRYEIETVGGKYSSMPLLIKADSIKLSAYTESYIANGGMILNLINSLSGTPSTYKLFAKLQHEDDITNWRDLLLNLNIYISIPSAYISNTYLKLNNRNVTTQSDGAYVEVLGEIECYDFAYSEKSILEQSAVVFKVKSIPIFDSKGIISKEITSLLEGNSLSVCDDKLTPDFLMTQDRLSGDDMQHYATSSKSLATYNNQLILTQPTQLINYDYNNLNSYIKHEVSDGLDITYTYDITYLVHAFSEDKVIKKQFIYKEQPSYYEQVYAFQIFPDSRCYKFLAKITGEDSSGIKTITYGEFDMHPHPYLDCAYYYGGIENSITDLCGTDRIEDHTINNVDDLESKIYVSSINDPFTFPLEQRFTFQSKVIGVAIASTALSQGQFGQYPLYVFTEDGIWAMETAADGSFVSQKPLSREVCVNPNSITSIDNAVIFVTDKAVMLIQGSEVVNISAYMNGKHYVPNDSARSIIAKQDGFGIYDSAISDETPFMAFMKKASIAYDYVGQRLICFAPEETFQYIYKIDTQTWHKTKFGEINLTSPLNSYPECLVASTYKSDVTYIEAAIRPNYTIEQAEEDSNNIVTNCANMEIYADTIPNLFKAENLYGFIKGEIKEVIVTGDVEDFVSTLNHFVYGINPVDKCVINTEERPFSKIYNLSTVLDTTENQDAAKGILITRPFDLGMPDVYKSISSIKIRGDYETGDVKYILQGSDNGRDFYTLSSLRGKSWKMFRIFILADLKPTERISWIDIDFEPKFNNRLR